MPIKYRIELLADWYGASMVQGNGGRSKDWYERNRDKIFFAPETRKWIEENISNNHI